VRRESRKEADVGFHKKRTLTVTFDVTGWMGSDIAKLEGEVCAQGERSKEWPDDGHAEAHVVRITHADELTPAA
jgi:hypothetical protein